MPFGLWKDGQEAPRGDFSVQDKPLRLRPIWRETGAVLPARIRTGIVGFTLRLMAYSPLGAGGVVAEVRARMALRARRASVATSLSESCDLLPDEVHVSIRFPML